MSKGRQSSELVKEAIKRLRAGEFVVVVDDVHREHEGDLVMAAEFANEENLAFMVRHSSGVIVVAMTGDRLDELELPLMVPVDENTESQATAFTVSVDARDKTTSGISCADRAMTIRALADDRSTPQAFRRPGHVFPLRSRDGGVLERPGHTEAGVDLLLLAGMVPAAALGEIMKVDGTMARTSDLIDFSETNGFVMISIDDIVRFRESPK